MPPKNQKSKDTLLARGTRKAATTSAQKSDLKATAKSTNAAKAKVNATSGSTSRTKRARDNEPAVNPPEQTKRRKVEPRINTRPDRKLDVYVFGEVDYSELGLGPRKRNGKSPKSVKRPRLNDLLDSRTVGVTQIAVGGMHCVALTHDNKIITWGVNDNGALGRDTTVPTVSEPEDSGSDSDDDELLNPKESTPTTISSDAFGEDVEFSQVVASDSASFALTVTGAVYGWGTFSGSDGTIGFRKDNTLAMAGLNKKDIQRTPILIPELKKITALAAGGNHILALSANGKVFAWGCGEQNQLGRRIVPRTRVNALVPSEFGLSRRRIKSISCGAFHSFAIDDQDRVFTWGLNNFGQTGVNNGAGESNAIVETPTIVESLREFRIREIRGGNHHSIACTQDQKILTWGRCDDCQIGIRTDRLPQAALLFNSQGKPRILSEPTIIPGLSANVVAAGIDNSFAIDPQGKVHSWGFSANYRTGQGTDDSIIEPTLIANTALVGKKLTFAGCGGQFSVLAGPADDGI